MCLHICNVLAYDCWYQQSRFLVIAVHAKGDYHLLGCPAYPADRGEFGVVQIQALCKGKEWLIPSSRALQATVSYVNSHSERGGVQAMITVVEGKVTTFWRSMLRHDVQVMIRSADVPCLRLRLGLFPEDDSSAGGRAKDAVVSLAGEEPVRQYLTQALAKVILPSIGARASFHRLLFHICVVGKTC